MSEQAASPESGQLPPKEEWVGDRPSVLAHLGMIQTIVARMATSSASCKTWCLALLGAMTGLAGATHQPAVLGYVVIVVLVFWYLDVRYLAQEKAYRDLFNALAGKVRDVQKPYGLLEAFNLKAETTSRNRWGAFFSWSTLPVYLTIVVSYLVAWKMGWIWKLA